jgi:AraC-like DNA-binding protein
LRESFYCRSELRAPWGLSFPDRDGASFHFVAEGSCCLVLGDHTTFLGRGDFVLLPRGQAHAFADRPETRPLPVDQAPLNLVGPGALALERPGDGPRSVLICGGLSFSGSSAHPLLEHLPDTILLRQAERDTFAWLQPTLDAMAREVADPRPGSPVVLLRLSELLVIQALRTWMEGCPLGACGWLQGMKDPHIGRSLALMHSEPGQPWDLENLSRSIGLSRAVFVERFTRLMGDSPKSYLTGWRMHLASIWLKEDRLTLAATAERLGYGSEAAFSRAFKRRFGMAPGGLKRSGNAGTGRP